MFEKQIDELLKQLTLEEKIGMIHGNGLFRTEGVPRLGIPPLYMSDGPMGVRYEFENSEWKPKGNTDDFVTYLPSGGAIASTWNRRLAYWYGQVLGEEARGRKKDVILAPSVNIIRSPLCGRNFEYLSEDPYLASQMAVPMVKGIQEKDVSACVKHFAANNQETERLFVDVIVGEKTLHEIYFPAFKACVQQANTYSVMGAYNKINGEYCSQSSTLLNRVLRDRWGFQNMVVSDWSAVNNTLEAANSGIDIEMSVHKRFDEYYMANPLKELILSNQVEESKIDEKVRNILRVMFQLRILGETSRRNAGSYNSKKHQERAYEIAKEAIVLLKNKEHILPLSKHISKILIIGENADRVHSKGGGSAEIKALYEITPLMAIKAKLGGNTQVDYVQGYFAHDLQSETDLHWQETSLETKEDLRNRISTEIKEHQDMLRKEALKKAADYDTILYFGGLNHDFDLEAQDRSNLQLPYEQDQLIVELLKINPNTILYFLSGSALDLSVWESKAKAILWSSYNGMEGANALADILFGDCSPSGKLTQTFAYNLTDYSSHSIGEFPGTDQVKYTEEEYVGYRHFTHQHIKPAFCFGHGLSYSEFKLSNFAIESKNTGFIIHLDLTNIGSMDASQTIQIYVQQQKENKVPVLKAFEKVSIQAKETKSISIPLNYSAFHEYEVKEKDFVLQKGNYEIAIATSIEEIHHTFHTTI